jgi:hypothetical protein
MYGFWFLRLPGLPEKFLSLPVASSKLHTFAFLFCIPQQHHLEQLLLLKNSRVYLRVSSLKSLWIYIHVNAYVTKKDAQTWAGLFPF